MVKNSKDSAGNLRFTGGKLQNYTALTPGLGLIWLILASTFADLLGSRWGLYYLLKFSISLVMYY